MKALSIFLLFFLFLIVYADQAAKETIAIIDFEDLTNSNLGPQVAEFLRTSLAQTKKFTIVERAQLEKVIKEQKFTMTELVDPTNAAKFGKLIGANYITIGSITKFGSCWLINARFIDVNTAQTIKAAQAKGNSQDEFIDMMNSLIKQLTGAEIIETNIGDYKRGDIIFHDDFNGTISNYWIIDSRTNVPISPNSGYIVIGKKTFNDKNIGILTLDPKYFSETCDYRVEFEIKQLNPAWHMNSGIRFIDSQITIELPNFDREKIRILQNNALLNKTEYINNEYNKIIFERIGKAYHLYINNSDICSGAANISQGSIIEFFTEGSSIIAIKNVIIYAI